MRLLSQYPLRWAPSSDGRRLPEQDRDDVVSIPSQVGTLFGRRRRTSTATTRTVSIPSQVGTLFGPAPRVPNQAGGGWSQYPLRWAPSSDFATGGSGEGRATSQYPLRWAPSSDTPSSPCLFTSRGVSIPSQVGTLFGLHVDRVGDPGDSVSIPSQVGTLFGQTPWMATSSLTPSLNTLSGGHPLRTKGVH